MRVGEILRSQDHAGRLIGAICAGPKCFLPHKIAQDKLVTSYPLFQKDMEAAGTIYNPSYTLQDKILTDLDLVTWPTMDVSEISYFKFL